MSLPHDSQAGLGALRRRLWLGPARFHGGLCGRPVLLGLRQRDDPLLPAAVRLLLPAGNHRVAVAAGVGGGVRDGGRPLVVVRHFDVAGAAAVRVVDLRPDAAVHHADQVCGLSGERIKFRDARTFAICLSPLSFQGFQDVAESVEAADEQL